MNKQTIVTRSLESTISGDAYELRYKNEPVVCFELDDLDDNTILYYDFNAKKPAIETVGAGLDMLDKIVDFVSFCRLLRKFPLYKKDAGQLTLYLYEKEAALPERG